MAKLIVKTYGWLFVASLSLSACGKNFSADNGSGDSSQASSQGGDTAAGDGGSGNGSDGSTDGSLNICGRLSFQGISWPQTLPAKDRKSLATSLNLTGSYEGGQGWINITNNFDGMGMSLGLLQQNFGSGSLQPLLLKFRTQDRNQMQSFFANSDFTSLENMLLQNSFMAALAEEEESPELFPNKMSLSPLDESPMGFSAFSSSSGSVNWAVGQLYAGGDGRTFIPRWKNSFQSMANSASYRSLQVESAVRLYKKAQNYFQTFGFREFRSMLLMYDFVVQNGGFNSTHLSLFNAYKQSNPQASETERAMKLLEIRLTSVRTQYRGDVYARKSTIILGTGKVHGNTRNMPKEFCYNPNDVI